MAVTHALPSEPLQCLGSKSLWAMQRYLSKIPSDFPARHVTCYSSFPVKTKGQTSFPLKRLPFWHKKRPKKTKMGKQHEFHRFKKSWMFVLEKSISWKKSLLTPYFDWKKMLSGENSFNTTPLTAPKKMLPALACESISPPKKICQWHNPATLTKVA